MNIKLEEHIVAFLDILGFRQIVEQMSYKPELAGIIFKVLEQLKEIGGVGVGDTSIVKTLTFSDSIILSVEKNHFSCGLLVTYLHKIHVVLMQLGIFTRGAVVVGPLLHKSKIAFGPALIEAYDLELKAAHYPRIIISGEACRLALGEDQDQTSFLPDLLPIKQDIDGWYYIDSFSEKIQWGEPDTVDVSRSWFESMRPHIVDALYRAHEAKNANVRAKYIWLSAKFNEAIKEQNIKIPAIDLPKY